MEKRTELLHSVIANAPVVIWAADRDGKLLLCEGKGLCGHQTVKSSGWPGWLLTLQNGTRSVIEICRELVKKIIIEARHLISGLRPPILDDLGLVPAIKHLVYNHNKGGQTIEFAAETDATRLAPFVEGPIYRIA